MESHSNACIHVFHQLCYIQKLLLILAADNVANTLSVTLALRNAEIES